MANYSKYNIVYRLQKWMDTVQGQTFLNYAYSWGASVVILGALFKLTHLPGANLMLFIGMGTEVLVFFISAFDRPFDKTADGREMPTRLTEEFLQTGKAEYGETSETASAAPQAVSAAAPSGNGGGTKVVVIGGGGVAGGSGTVSTATQQPHVKAQQPAVEGQEIAGGAANVRPSFVPQMSAEQAEALNEAQGNYVEELKKLVDTLQKVNEQSSRLTRDSEEMENLNRTLTGISRVYEMQLKGASQQIGTIDQINEQSKRMAEHIEQLNKIYTRMIEAMTVNMRSAAPGTTQTV